MSELPPPGRPRPAGPLLRAFFRLPVWLHRRGFPGSARLFGQEWLLLTTVGRRSGLPRRVMLDLLGHDPATGRYYVQPGWEREAHWVRNVEANPEVEVQAEGETFRAVARDVSGDEGAGWIERFNRAHPVRNWLIGRLVLGQRVPVSFLTGRGRAAHRDWFADHFVVFALERTEPPGTTRAPEA